MKHLNSIDQFIQKNWEQLFIENIYIENIIMNILNGNSIIKRVNYYEFYIFYHCVYVFIILTKT